MADKPQGQIETFSALHLTCAIFGAYVRNNTLPAADVPAALRSVYQVLNDLSGAPAVLAHSQKPAVPVKKSVARDYIICLEDGRKLKMLKRYIRTQYGMSPQEYRAKWNLPSSYPMTAPGYAAVRAAFAKRIGLGRRPARASRRKG